MWFTFSNSLNTSKSFAQETGELYWDADSPFCCMESILKGDYGEGLQQ